MERDTFLKIGINQIANVVRVVGVAHKRVSHFLTRRKNHLSFLQMKRRLEQLARVAGMVVVRVGDDRLANVVQLDAGRQQRINRAPQKSPFARTRSRLTETGIDQDGFIA